ncbi:MAG: arsenic resistance protein, partial [Microcystaceae cyanobacterium]
MGVSSSTSQPPVEKLSIFQRYLTLWVFLCIVAGIVLGRSFPGVASWLDSMSISQVSIPIAVCLFFMMYPIMVKIDFSQIDRAFRTPKPVLLTLVINWLIKPFTMLAIAQ